MGWLLTRFCIAWLMFVRVRRTRQRSSSCLASSPLPSPPAWPSRTLPRACAHASNPTWAPNTPPPRHPPLLRFSSLLPLLLILYLFNQVRVVLSARKLLLLCNLYLALYCFGLLLASIIISGEPMASLRQLAQSNFYVLQILQACGYLLYLLLQVCYQVLPGQSIYFVALSNLVCI